MSVSDEGRDRKPRGNRKVDDARTNAIRDATPGVQSPAQVKEMGGAKANRKKMGAGMDDEHQ
jgi:hypothetical protein